MTKLTDVFKNMQEIMSANEYSDARFEADCLIEYVLGRQRPFYGTDYLVSSEREDKLYSLCEKRKNGYPLQYILGKWQFFDMELSVGEGVLIPRQDTEDVCLRAFDYIKKFNSPNVLDLCSGTGAIALATKKYCPAANVVALEKYDDAYRYLEKNIKDTGLSVLPIKADVFGFDYVIEPQTFDVIISNPPYIDEKLKGKLQTEVSFEPDTALFAGQNGLWFYKFIAKYYYKAIKDDGYLIFEYGYDQADDVRYIVESNQYAVEKEIVDTRGNPRGIIARKLRDISSKILD